MLRGVEALQLLLKPGSNHTKGLLVSSLWNTTGLQNLDHAD